MSHGDPIKYNMEWFNSSNWYPSKSWGEDVNYAIEYKAINWCVEGYRYWKVENEI